MQNSFIFLLCCNRLMGKSTFGYLNIINSNLVRQFMTYDYVLVVLPGEA